jgi:hypothetical protein
MSHWLVTGMKKSVWFTTNKLTLNFDKTHLMKFDTKYKACIYLLTQTETLL